MCYHLTIASPLTLSEVRSMLPAGLGADPLPSAELARFRAILPAVQTAAHLRVGTCSCDLVRPRLDDAREDERHLRARYRSLGLPRDRVIRELERHRRPAPSPEPAAGWRAALAGFVAEHARNAGTTVYQLTFGPEAKAGGTPLTRTVAEVRADPEGWLVEGAPVLVAR